METNVALSSGCQTYSNRPPRFWLELALLSLLRRYLLAKTGNDPAYVDSHIFADMFDVIRMDRVQCIRL